MPQRPLLMRVAFIMYMICVLPCCSGGRPGNFSVRAPSTKTPVLERLFLRMSVSRCFMGCFRPRPPTSDQQTAQLAWRLKHNVQGQLQTRFVCMRNLATTSFARARGLHHAYDLGVAMLMWRTTGKLLMRVAFIMYMICVLPCYCGGRPGSFSVKAPSPKTPVLERLFFRMSVSRCFMGCFRPRPPTSDQQPNWHGV